MFKKKSFKYLVPLMLVIGSYISVSANDDEYTTDINWQRYSISARGISVNFPKIPVSQNQPVSCAHYKGVNYAAYADETVYEMRVTYQIPKEDISESCYKTFSGPKKFNRSIMADKVKGHEAQGNTRSKKIKLTDGREVVFVTTEHTRIWLFDDIKNGKIVELLVSHRKDKDPDISKFVDSLDLIGKQTGINLVNGSDRTIGDRIKSESDDAASEKSEDDDRMRIFFTPRANYTAQARDDAIQGTVRLRVTFLPNGSIGNIAVIKGLPLGMTEEAIKAARKIVFIPRRVNGANVNVSQIVEYNFSIY